MHHSFFIFRNISLRLTPQRPISRSQYRNVCVFEGNVNIFKVFNNTAFPQGSINSHKTWSQGLSILYSLSTFLCKERPFHCSCDTFHRLIVPAEQIFLRVSNWSSCCDEAWWFQMNGAPNHHRYRKEEKEENVFHSNQTPTYRSLCVAEEWFDYAAWNSTQYFSNF